MTRLLAIDKDSPFQTPPPSPVALLPLIVLPSIMIGPRFAKMPPPIPIAGSLAVVFANLLSLIVLPALITIGPPRASQSPPPT